MHLTLSLLALGTIFSAATSLIPPDPEVDVVHVKVQGVDEMECEKEVCAIHAPIQVGNDIPPVPVPVPSQIQIKLEDDVQDQDRNEDEIEEVLERRKAKGGKGKGGGGGSRGNSSTSSSCGLAIATVDELGIMGVVMITMIAVATGIVIE